MTLTARTAPGNSFTASLTVIFTDGDRRLMGIAYRKATGPA
jgi:hypothetical protein